MSQISDFSVGQEVVAMSSPGVPCRCNPGPNPFRVKIIKVGRSKVYGMMIGYKNPIGMKIPSRLDDKGLIAYPIDEARRLYREALESRGFYSPDRVNQLVESL